MIVNHGVTQKNPGATRHPEEDKGVESYQMDLMIDLSLAHLISPHIARVCEDAADATYIRDMDLKLIATSKMYTSLNHVIVDSCSDQLTKQADQLCENSKLWIGLQVKQL